MTLPSHVFLWLFPGNSASLIGVKNLSQSASWQKIKIAPRFSYSRKMFVVAYPCETQEMVLDAHNKALSFGGERGQP